MTCREFQEALAEDPSGGGRASPEALTHVAECDACAAAADDVREAWAAVLRTGDERTSVPPARTDEAWTAARRTLRAGRVVGSLRFAARAAVLLLAATGVLAAFGARAESSDGRVSVSLALPWSVTSAARAPSAEDERTALRLAIEEALAAAERRIAAAAAARDALRDEVHSESLLLWAQWLDERHRADAEALATELVGLRSELAATRFVQEEMVAARAGPPALPDPR